MFYKLLYKSLNDKLQKKYTFKDNNFKIKYI